MFFKIVLLFNDIDLELELEKNSNRNVAISRSSQCSTTGVTKAVVCIILSVG